MAKNKKHTGNQYNHDRIKSEGIIVDDRKGLPTYGEMYIMPYYVITIHHSGTLKLDYDSQTMVAKGYSISIVYPNHALLGHDASDDYRSTAIMVSAEQFDSMSNHIALRDRFANEQCPCISLTIEQYNDIMTIVEAMRTVSRLNTAYRVDMLRNMVFALVEMANVFRVENNGTTRNDSPNSLSKRFYEALTQHCPPHRDVSYYADLFCLSTKYFSHRIMEETGHSAGHWLHQYVIAQSKLLMHNRSDASLQQIALMLGFPEQSSFSRYFKRETGISPDTWRRM